MGETKDGMKSRRNSRMIDKAIKKLVTYGLDTGLISEDDRYYAVNQILDVLWMDEYEEPQDEPGDIDLEEVLAELLDYAFETGIIPENSITYRGIFDTKLMNCLMPRPSEVETRFWGLYNHQSPQAATEYYYKLSQDSDYIRRYRIKKDMRWVTASKYGDLDITINLSKPEKDPKAIAAAKLAKQSGYPKCQLCMENEGYAGRTDHPARNNHRIIRLKINDSQWGFQYSPYVYYNEHCIVFNGKHTPMKIERDTFVKLFDFVKQFPHYFLGSNADLPIVGGSILSHDHFQGGNYDFAMAKAKEEELFCIKGFERVTAGIVKWPMTVLRTRSTNPEDLIELGTKVLKAWRAYTDESLFVFASTGGQPHNTITPIARKRGDAYELDLVLRNNITTKEFPYGVYHPHEELHHIKKENIGLIEVMGLAVLPSRLKDELNLISEYLIEEKDIRSNEFIEKHADWVDSFRAGYKSFTKDNIDEILEKEVGLVFERVLEDAGVFKYDEAGRAGFKRFLTSMGFESVSQ
jgi:UDPglucose--hexose-1-phosphate uridylyltransferase